MNISLQITVCDIQKASVYHLRLFNTARLSSAAQAIFYRLSVAKLAIADKVKTSYYFHKMMPNDEETPFTGRRYFNYTHRPYQHSDPAKGSKQAVPQRKGGYGYQPSSRVPDARNGHAYRAGHEHLPTKAQTFYQSL